MPKIAYVIIACVLALTAVTVVSITGVSAYDETKFVPYSVLAADQADYGVDDNPLTIHAVSPSIIEGKVEDIESSLVKTIEYTSLPARDTEPSTEDNDHLQPQDQTEVHNNYGNDGSGGSVSDQSQANNQTNNQNNNSNNGKGKGKDKNKDKGKGNSAGNGGGNNDGKTNEKSSGNDTANENGAEKVK